MRDWLKGKSALRRFLLLDAAIVLCMVLLSLPLYARQLERARQDLLHRDQEHSRQAAQELDATALRLISTAGQRWSMELSRLALSGGTGDDPSIYYTMSTVQRELRSAFFSYEDVEVAEAMLFFKRNAMAVSNNRVFPDRERFFRYFLRYGEYSPQEAEEFLTSNWRSIRLLPCQETGLFSLVPAEDMMALLMPIRMDSTLLCVFLRANRLADPFLQGLDAEAAFLLMRNHEGQTLLLRDAPEDWETAAGYERIEQTVPALGITVTLGIPKAAFSRQVRSERNLIIMYTAFICLAGMALAFSMAWHSAKPVRTLVRTLKLSPDAGESEYSAIEAAFSNLASSYDQLARDAEALSVSLTQNRLGQLFFGSGFLTGREEEFLQELPALREPHRVAVLSVSFTGEAPENELLLTRVGNALRSYEPVYFLSSSMLALLLPAGAEDAFTQALSRIDRQAALAQPGARVCAGVSQADTGTAGLSRDFVQAMDNLSIASEGQPVRFEESAAREKEDGFAFDVLARMYNQLMTGNRDAFFAELSALRESGALSTARQRKRIYYGMDLVLSSARAGRNLSDEETVLPHYEDSLSLDELCGRIERAADELCDALEKRRSSGNTELKRRLVEYVDAHIADPNLCAEMAADDCGLSVKYLHRIFHEQTGRSMAEYMEEKRMGMAREMLARPRDSVSDISTACGFRSLNSFYKAFKRVHGLSPSEYRNQLEKNQ